MTYAFNTLRDCQYIFRATSGGTAFSSNLATTAATDYFSNSAVLNDAIYFSSPVQHACYAGLNFTVGTALAGTLTLTWEYRTTSSTWGTLTVTDGTSGFTTTGTVTWTPPTNWTRTTVNGQERMWVRVRISALTSITEGGANTTNKMQAFDFAITCTSEASCTPETIYQADVAAGWGLVTRIGVATYAYYIGCNVFFSSSTFVVRNCGVIFGYNTWNQINSTFTVGEVIDAASGTTKNGAWIKFDRRSTSGFQVPQFAPTAYGSLIQGYASDVSFGTIIGCLFEGSRMAPSGTCRRLNILSTLMVYSGLTYDDIFVHDTTTALRAWTNSGVLTRIAEKPKIRNCTYTVAFEGSNTTAENFYLRDPDADKWTINWGYGGAPYAQTLHRQYSINLKVIDKNDIDIADATVIVLNNLSTQQFSTTTSADGTITAQNVTSHKYSWVSGSYPGVTTDTDYNDFTMTISKTGYQTKTYIFQLTAPINWTVVLEPIVKIIYPIDCGPIYNIDSSNSANNKKFIKMS